MERSGFEDLIVKKKCSRCGIEKSLSKFYNQLNKKSGKESRCIECKKITKETHEQNNLKKIIEQNLVERDCRICKEIKPLSEFHKSKAGIGGRVAICKPCLKPLSRLKTIKRKAIIRNQELKKAYGITTEDYNKMLYAQKGVCKICNTKSQKNLHVDHCHKTGKVRGLLCGRCNMSLGAMKENIQFIKNMIIYLENQ